MLYERDYNLGLTEDELIQYRNITGRDFGADRSSGFGRVNTPSKYPKAARMFKTLFPNNYLDFIDLKDNEKLSNINERYLKLIDDADSTERDIINFIKAERGYHVIGSIVRGCHLNTGHNGAFLFPEFQLSNCYVADYLLCGRSSGGYEFVFVELEHPRGNITMKNGDLGHEIRDGISQLKEWRRWLESNYSSFNTTFKKYKNPNIQLPEEFYTLDSSRFHYVIVAGRRSDFAELTHRIRREIRQSENINILHYDNLYDYSNLLIGKNTY